MDQFDLIVIGAGPGGYVAAIRAAQMGLKTAIIDRQWLGGVCLNVGCVPSKALLKNAEVAHILRDRSRDFGFTLTGLTLDYSQAVKRSRQVSDRLTKGVGFLMKKNNIEVILGEARFSDAHQVVVRLPEGTERQLTAKEIIIATGSSVINIPGMEPDGRTILSYKDAILQETLPGSVIIIGGGAIGAEFATIWRSYGVDVTIVEMLPHLLPAEDSEVAAELTRAFQKRGIKVMTGTRVETVSVNSGRAEVIVSQGEERVNLEAEQVLVAIGFKPNSVGLNLEQIGVNLSPKGHVIVDDRMATNVDGIWAIGDVTGKMLLAHVASTQALVCVEAMTGGEPTALNYMNMPRVTYCQPQVASFGLTEDQAKDAGLDYTVGKFPFLANGKSLGLGESMGFVKVLADKNSGKILGAHLVGADVAELLPELTLAQAQDLSMDTIAHNVHAHPTLSEAILEAAHAIEGRPIHI